MDKEYLLRLLRASDGLHADIMRELEHSGLFPAPLSYRGRVKGEETTVGKIKRKQIKTPTYGIDDIRDIIGIRFVTLYRMDIANVVAKLFQIIDNAVTPHARYLGSAKVEEFRQYVAGAAAVIDPETNDLTDALYQRLQLIGAQRPPGNPGDPGKLFEVESRAQYSSVHIVVSVEYRGETQTFNIPIEFQIRSLFEEAWAEIDHKLFYEADREGQEKGRQQRIAKSAYLRILKSMLDTAADYAGVISDLDPTAVPTPGAPVANSIDDASYARVLAAPLKTHGELLDEFVNLVEEKGVIDSDKGKRGLYLPLADRFETLAGKFDAAIRLDEFSPQEHDHITAIAFFIRMEEALCRFLAGPLAQLQKAIEIYKCLTDGNAYDNLKLHFRDHPQAWFRLAQAYAAMIENAESIKEAERWAEASFETYQKARTILEKTPKDRDTIISRSQRQYLEDNLERLQSFALWRLSDKRRQKADGRRPVEDDLDNVARAWGVCEGRLKDAKVPGTATEVRFVNGALYYAMDGRNIARELRRDTKAFPDDPTFKQLVDHLRLGTEGLDTLSEQPWHTIMKAYDHVGDRSGALAAARKVMRANVNADTSSYSLYQREMHERARAEAWKIIDSEEEDTKA